MVITNSTKPATVIHEVCNEPRRGPQLECLEEQNDNHSIYQEIGAIKIPITNEIVANKYKPSRNRKPQMPR